MPQSYENLSGGSGRAVNFRAERYQLRSLLSPVESELEIEGERVEIGDLSATGLCYLTERPDDHARVGGVVDYRIRLAGREAACGRGEVVRIQRGAGPARVGVHFLDRLVTPGALQALRADALFDAAVARGMTRYAVVPHDYREACAEAQLFLVHWQQLLDEREREIQREGRDASARLAVVEATAMELMRAEWGLIRLRAGTAADRIEEGSPAYAAARALTRVQLAPFLCRSPFLERCSSKPRGYPGDYLAMTWMYEGQRQGDTLFGRLLDQLGLEERLARTVPDRRDALLGHLRWSLRERSDRERRVRILSLGAGPARELCDWLAEPLPAQRLELVLVDQDEEALAFAHERLAAAALRHAGRVRLVCRHLSFRQLFSQPEQLAELGGCDLVYSAGLFDYLRKPVAEALIGHCFELLESGGRLLVGNAAAAPVVRWVPEFVLDWKMIYRNQDEMRAFGRPFEGRAELDLGADASGAWHLLSITRPG